MAGGVVASLHAWPPIRSSDEIVKVFVRAIVASYPYDELPASVLIENIYKDKCKNPK